MSSRTLLATDARARGITAMSVLVMARETTTRPIAEAIDLPSVKGENLRGVEMARAMLLDEFSRDPDAWAQWLSDAEHSNALASMVVAIDDEMFNQLKQNNETTALVAVIDDARARRAHNRAVAAALARRNGQPVIDITESRTSV